MRTALLPRFACAVLAVALISAAGDARADSPAPEAPPAPAATEAPPPAPAPAPGPTTAPTLTPALPAVTAPALEAPAPAPPAPRGKPFYRKDWFWGTVGVVVLTVGIVLIATAGSNNPAAPSTTLGNMRAF